jgi:hypothetical protein
MKEVRYFICSILLFFNDNLIIAKNREEADEFYERFHSDDILD